MQANNEKKVTKNKTGRLTILELMTVLAVLGVLLTWVVNKFFLS